MENELPPSIFKATFIQYFEHELTHDQNELVTQLEVFLKLKEPQQLFVLKGYAGTGKTSVLGAFVKTLSHFKVKTKLLAPTGRAAKVFSLKSKKEALTIHKQIYWRDSKVDEFSKMTLAKNLHTNTVFIVDEASMIIGDPTYGNGSLQNDTAFSARNLLEDLIEYVFSGINCRLILLGDEGQLPPVGSDFSPALSLDYLKNNFPLVGISSFSLTRGI